MESWVWVVFVRLRLDIGAYSVGALIIRRGFGGVLYYNYHKEPQNSIGNYQGSLY